MNDRDEFDRTLRAWFHDEARLDAPRHVFDAVVAATGGRSPRMGWLAILRGNPMDAPLAGIGHGGRVAILLAVAAALLLGLMAGAILSGGSDRLLGLEPPIRTASTPAPSESARPSVPPATQPGPEVAIEDTGNLVSGVTYTSNLFEPKVTFRLSAYGASPAPGQPTDWCDPQRDAYAPTSTRSVVLRYKMSCVGDLRIIRPYAVDCGTADAHPDAASLATAILANRGLGAMQDLGTPADSRFTIVPPGLLADRYPARVIKIDGSRAFDGTTTDPGHCRLLPEPGSSDPTIELRGDIGAVLILLDVDGRLIVLRVADGGYDARTGAEAASRGYGRDDAVLAVMLQIISEIRFAATSATIDRSGPTVEIPAGLTPTMTPATVEQMVLAAIARDEQRFHEALVPARVTAIRLMPPGSTVAGGAPGSGAGPFDRLTWAVTADGTFLSCGSHCSAYTSATTFIPDDGSSGSGPLGNGTGFAVPDPGFIAALSAQGQAFRPASAPTTGVISAGSVIGDLSQVHPKADFYGPIFGLVTCEDQMKLGPQGVGCAALGADKADQTTAIWWFDVGFRWVAIDATTGSTLARGGP